MLTISPVLGFHGIATILRLDNPCCNPFTFNQHFLHNLGDLKVRYGYGPSGCAGIIR